MTQVKEHTIMTKEQLIEKYRDINVDGDWWHESVYEWFEEQCEERGVSIVYRQEKSRSFGGNARSSPEISWSGFWSQGDGAAFAGYIDDVPKALGDRLKDYPIFNKYITELNGYFSFRWSIGNGNYIRFNGVEYEDIYLYLDEGEEHPLVDIWQSELAIEVEQVEIHLRDLADEMCYLLYKSLEDEYEALTSDEAVWDTIEANELDKEMDDGEIQDGSEIHSVAELG